MLLDGKKIAEKIKDKLAHEIATMSFPPMLVAFTFGDDPATKSYLAIKERFARDIGAVLEVAKLPETCTTSDLVERIKTIANDELVHGIIIQLPLPSQIDVNVACQSIPAAKDPDCLSGSSDETILPPIPGAVREIFTQTGVNWHDKKIVIIGRGKLVGRPVVEWLKSERVNPIVFTKDEGIDAQLIFAADIVISGAGAPGLIKPEMVKDGAVLIDAGTSEDGGKIAGDIDPACAEKASVFTPVPGGVGPIAVAKLFENLVYLVRHAKNN